MGDPDKAAMNAGVEAGMNTAARLKNTPNHQFGDEYFAMAVSQDAARAALRSQSPEPSSSEVRVPKGWKLVPEEPSDKMMIAGGFSFAGRVPNKQVYPEVHKVWDAMLGAAPAAEVDPAQAFSSWLNEGPKLARAAGLYVGIKVYESEQAARDAGDVA